MFTLIQNRLIRSQHCTISNQKKNHQNVHISKYCALRAADLDWIVEPEYSLGGKEEGVQGRNKQKRDTRGVTTDLLDV